MSWHPLLDLNHVWEVPTVIVWLDFLSLAAWQFFNSLVLMELGPSSKG